MDVERTSVWVLIVASIATLMAALDMLVVTTALDVIRQSVAASPNALTWTITAYNLTFAVLLLPAASLGDRWGRRRLFLIGLTIFTLGSTGCALASSASWLIAARALQGAGAAVITPTALALIAAVFPTERRGRALGIASGVTGLSTLLGPVLGGAVTSLFGWSWIFWLNVPIGIITIVLTALKIPESRGARFPLDTPGLALLIVGIFSVIVGLNGISGSGAQFLAGTLLFGGVVLTVFVSWEHHARYPILPTSYFRLKSFTVGNTVTVLHIATVLGAVFMMAQFLQRGLGLTPVMSGLALLPWTGSMLLVAPIAGELSDRVGARPVMIVGLLLGATGLGWLALVVHTGMTYWEVALPLVFSGIGNSAAFPAVQKYVLTGFDIGELGRAVGVNSLIRELGGVLGIATAGGVFARYGSYSNSVTFIAGFKPTMALCAASLAAAAFLTLIVKHSEEFTAAVSSSTNT
ncbi:MFS transporter [Paenarthrobacter sp. PH39-S1]|uniref:MFS transporter n=1 Tax=Paenarthrobacter sp. PH39-S1 TaxID=3046204 RepID=UPI0024BACA16|nr:MFS transporter [Paenarthrobacter sp. PH39-S1]MDJ0356656.1 MFS transporter [Paenarthrobacter sp. PH39-S1]